MSLPSRLVAIFGLVIATLVMAGEARADISAGVCRHIPAPPGAAGKRIAVIVGNGAYGAGIPALPNPARDAQAVSQAMGALGFERFVIADADAAALQACLASADVALADADIALFYYSGHGIQISDENYLVATDASAAELRRALVPVQPIIDRLQASAKATLVFLDACRDNPLAKYGRPGLSVSTGRGLVRQPGPDEPSPAAAIQARGLMVAYSTSPNSVAADGIGDLSPFTAAFVRSVATSGYSIQRVMSEVTNSVGEETGWAQTPWMKSSLTGELKLGGGDTLAQALSLSENHASRSMMLLLGQGSRQRAIVEALKGLPASPDDAALKTFAKAYLALYSAVQTREVVLPVSQSGTVAMSVKDRVAISTVTQAHGLANPDLWSTTDQTIIARLPVVGQLREFRFSQRGRFLATLSSRRMTLWNSSDGSRYLDIRAPRDTIGFDINSAERRLLISRSRPTRLTIIDLATRRRTASIDLGRIVRRPAGAGAVTGVNARFGSDDTICFLVSFRRSRRYALGVFDLRTMTVTRLRWSPVLSGPDFCDPAGKFMVRMYFNSAAGAGMEIWNLAEDTVRTVPGPMVMAIDPDGDYVSGFATEVATQGLYDLRTGRKGYPATVPEGFVIFQTAVVRNPSGMMIGADTSRNPWLMWPDETLFGPALVDKALAELTPEERRTVERERIDYVAAVAER